jgi:outer membrane immunogenic protein
MLRHTCGHLLADFFSGVDGSTVLDYQTKIDWFGTVRGRLGYVWGNGNVMSYLTGGLAYGKVDLEGTSTINADLGGLPAPFSIAQAFGHSQVNAGWVVGGGTEGRLDFWGLRNWTWKIEGLYMDLGHLDTAGSGIFPSTTFPVPPITVYTSSATAQVTTQTHFTDSIVRVGLNYQFH